LQLFFFELAAQAAALSFSQLFDFDVVHSSLLAALLLLAYSSKQQLSQLFSLYSCLQLSLSRSSSRFQFFCFSLACSSIPDPVLFFFNIHSCSPLLEIEIDC